MHSSPFVIRSGDKRVFDPQSEQFPCYGEHDFYFGDKRARASGWHRMPLEAPIEPHENDVLMGRGGRNNQHSGNDKLRELARTQSDNYKTSSKKGKSAISRSLVQKMHELDPPARFLKRVQQTAEWEEVGDDTAREKASQVLRDAVAGLLEPSESSEPIPHVPSVPVSVDEHERNSARSRACLRPRPECQHSYSTYHNEMSSKRRRYSASSASYQEYDEPYSSAHVVAGYSPIRRHFGANHRLGVHSDPSARRSHGDGYTSRSSFRHTQPPVPSQQPGGALDEFDLFNGELLESDSEETGPPPTETPSDAF